MIQHFSGKRRAGDDCYGLESNFNMLDTLSGYPVLVDMTVETCFDPRLGH